MKGTLRICLILAVFASISTAASRLQIKTAHRNQNSLAKLASPVHRNVVSKSSHNSAIQHKVVLQKKQIAAPQKRAHLAASTEGVQGAAITSAQAAGSSQKEEISFYEESSSVNGLEDSDDSDDDDDYSYNDEDYDEDNDEGSDFWNKKSAKAAHKLRSNKP